MNKTQLYQKYFENNSRFFWPEVKRAEHPSVMAGAVRHKIMCMAGIIKVDAGKEVLGHWTWQFSILADELYRLHTREMAHKEIERFRDCARRGVDYQRLPDNQEAIFKSDLWKTPAKCGL